MQRTKGAAYEREVAQVFNDALDLPTAHKVKRNIGQSRDGGYDLPVGPLAVEAKRRKTLATVEGWMAQCERAARDEGLIPTVVARQDQGESLVIMRLDDFLELAGDVLREEIFRREERAADADEDEGARAAAGEEEG